MTDLERKTLSEVIQVTNQVCQELNAEEKREYYSKIRNERDKATFAMMMRMNPAALTAIRKEFFIRKDAVKVDEFIYIITKHLLNSQSSAKSDLLPISDQREFGLNMYELFKEIDVNGDGDLEWQEFTAFTVERANLLNSRQKLANLGHFHDSSDVLDPSAGVRHRHDIARAVVLKSIHQFAIVEDHRNSIFIFNSRHGRLIHTITTEAAPIAVEYIPDREKDLLVATGADMTMSTYSLLDPNPNRRYQLQQSWATPGVQMTIAYQPESRLLYSGATNGSIYSWNIKDRNLISTLSGHSDIVMSLKNISELNNVASASLDKTICIWDSCTNERLLHLHGHRKGIFDLTYSSEYRLLVSCGFEHDALVWSPFVNNMMGKLRGHHASLVGCIAVEGKPELITGDTSGVLKLWDIRNFSCVQTFSANTSNFHGNDNFKMSCFFHCSLPSRNAMQKEDDSRIYAASKMLSSFDQARIVHEATTDKTNVFWVTFIQSKSLFVTVSERNVIIWDAFTGSKTQVNLNIAEEEITACCLDDRQRKIIIGTISGNVAVYNLSNGSKMKDVDKKKSYGTVIGISYVSDSRRFIVGHQYGYILVYDENTLEECTLLRQFERISYGSRLNNLIDDMEYVEGITRLSYNPKDSTVATIAPACHYAKLWNFVTGKLEYELSSNSDENEYIVYIDFLTPYPLVITCDSVGNVVIWGSRGCRWPGMRLSGFLNQTILNGIYKPIDKLYSFSEEVQPPIIIPPTHGDAILGNYQTKQSLPRLNTNSLSLSANNERTKSPQISPLHSTKSTNSTKGSKMFDKPNLTPKSKSNVSNNRSNPKINRLTPKNSNNMMKILSYDDYDDDGSTIGSPGQSILTNDLQLPNRYHHLDTGKSDLAVISFEEAKQLALLCEEKWGNIAPILCVSWSPEKKILFIGDDMGVLRCYELNDLFHDLNGESMLDETKKSYHMKDYCRRHQRTVKSALPPCHSKYMRYLIGNPDDAMGYLGINYQWTLYAHDDRILTCHTTSYGILTSSADRMVKMWTYQGEPIGRLLQSIPTGIRNKSWKLELDVDQIIQQENNDLNDILQKVHVLEDNPENNPDIETYDYTGLEPGVNASNFNRSNLRRRIDKTWKILGLDTPQDQSESHLINNNASSYGLPSFTNLIAKSMNNNSKVHRHGSILRKSLFQDSLSSDFTLSNEGSLGSNQNHSMTQSNKSVSSAMKELKSIDGSIDYINNQHMMSYRQRKSRTKKMTLISTKIINSVNQRMNDNQSIETSSSHILNLEENQHVIENQFNNHSSGYKMDHSIQDLSNQSLSTSSLHDISDWNHDHNYSDMPMVFGLDIPSSTIHPKIKINLDIQNNATNRKRSSVLQDTEEYVKESNINAKLMKSCSKFSTYNDLEKALANSDWSTQRRRTLKEFK